MNDKKKTAREVALIVNQTKQQMDQIKNDLDQRRAEKIAEGLSYSYPSKLGKIFTKFRDVGSLITYSNLIACHFLLRWSCHSNVLNISLMKLSF